VPESQGTRKAMKVTTGKLCTAKLMSNEEELWGAVGVISRKDDVKLDRLFCGCAHQPAIAKIT